MSNVKENNFDNIKLKLNYSKYWDFTILKDRLYGSSVSPFLIKDNLISYIDLSNDNCIGDNSLYSLPNFTWDKAISDNVVLKNIGLCGVDNGLRKYNKYEISNEDFLNLLTKTPLSLPSNDIRLVLYPVFSNNDLFDYSTDIVQSNNIRYLKCNGGFYQGFFKTYGYDYQVLPSSINNNWQLEFTLRLSDYTNKNETINKKYPNNAGIFFYMGTRAENKFFQFYNKDFSMFTPTGYIDPPDYCDNASYYEDNEDGYCSSYFEDEDFFKKNISIDDQKMDTENGIPQDMYKYYEFKSNNKFLFYNHTKDGFTTDTWQDNDIITFTGSTPNFDENLFTVLNHTDSGVTVDELDTYISGNTKDYNVDKDIINNAFALRLKKGLSGYSIGYRYLISNCDNDNKFSIQEEYSKELINDLNWHDISVRIAIVNGENKCETTANLHREMKLYIYLDGYLIFISRSMPEFNFVELNDTKEKQEGVAFNLSLGGGTQGLSDVVYMDFTDFPKYILNLEKNFAGSFIGDIKAFKFYNDYLNLSQIKSNYLYEKSQF